MRPLIAIALLCVAAPAAVGAPPGTGTLALTPDSEARWIPFELTPGNQIRFTASLDDRPLAAVLDTGASQSVLSRAFADRTGMKVATRGHVAAIGGAIPMGWVPVDTIAFGGLRRAGGGLNVVALPTNVTGGDGSIELLVGRDLIDRYALEIDYAGRRFRLLRSGRMPFTGTRAPLRIARAPLAYVTEIAVAGRRLSPIMVDTGDGTSLTLSRDAWRTLPLSPAPAMTTQLAYGVGGSVEADIAKLPRVDIGQRSARNVGVWIERSGGFSETSRSAGRIGMGFLQRYRVLLDPAAGHMILADTPASAEPPPRSTSGLQLGLVRDRLRVLHVMRGSPAAAAGWRVNETICAVDGVTVASDTAAAARSDWPYGAVGRQIALGMCDGTSRTLTLRRFY